MSNIVEVDFGADKPNPDQLYDDLMPIIDQMVEVACKDVGEEVGCLLVQSIAQSLHKIGEMLEEQIEITDEVELTLESGQAVSLELEEKE